MIHSLFHKKKLTFHTKNMAKIRSSEFSGKINFCPNTILPLDLNQCFNLANPPRLSYRVTSLRKHPRLSQVTQQCPLGSLGCPLWESSWPLGRALVGSLELESMESSDNIIFIILITKMVKSFHNHIFLNPVI